MITTNIKFTPGETVSIIYNENIFKGTYVGLSVTGKFVTKISDDIGIIETESVFSSFNEAKKHFIASVSEEIKEDLYKINRKQKLLEYISSERYLDPMQ